MMPSVVTQGYKHVAPLELLQSPDSQFEKYLECCFYTCWSTILCLWSDFLLIL